MDEKQMRKRWFKKPLDWEYMEQLINVRKSPTELGRDGALLAVTCYTAGRPSEIVQFKWFQFFYMDMGIREDLVYKTEKQSKLSGQGIFREIPILPEFEAILREYYEESGEPSLDSYLFPAGDRSSNKNFLDPKTLNRRIKFYAKKLDIPGWNSISAYSLRKGMIKAYRDMNGIDTTQMMTGHRTQQALLHYLGEGRDSVRAGYSKMFKSVSSISGMIENGLISVDVESIINGVEPVNWQDTMVKYLSQYTKNRRDIDTFTRNALAPYRAKLLKRKQMLS